MFGVVTICQQFGRFDNTLCLHLYGQAFQAEYFNFSKTAERTSDLACYYYYYFFLALRPNAGHGLLILDVSRSHTTTHHSQ